MTSDIEAPAGAAPPNYMTIYRDARRDAFVAEARDKPPFFEATSRVWIVAQPELCRELLTSPDLEPAHAVDRYHNLPADLEVDFASVRFAFEHIPLGLTGEAHAEARHRLSIYLASRRPPQAEWMERRLPALLAPFAEPGRFEVMSRVLTPLVRELFEVILDVDLPPELHIDDVSQAFDKAISMRRRKQLEIDLAALQAHIARRLGVETTDREVGMRLAIAVVGKETIRGTLGEALAKLFSDESGHRLADIKYPRMPHATGLPFVERIAVNDLVAGGQHIAAGEHVRIVLQTFALEPASQHHRFFGAGNHACLGRASSLDIWGAITSHLSRLPTRIALLQLEASRRSYVFSAPQILEVEITQ